MAIWNGLTETGAVVPIQVDDQGRVVVSGGGGLPSQVYGTAKDAASFKSDGAIYWSRGLTASSSGGGQYVCTFDTPRSNSNYAVLVQVTSTAASWAVIQNKSTTSFTVRAYDRLGDGANTTFDVAVFDNEPTDVTPLILPVAALNDIERLKDAVGLDDDSPIS